MSELGFGSVGGPPPLWRPQAHGGERLVAASVAAGQFDAGRLPADVITLPAPGREPIVICCPITGVPLTRTMAAASGVTIEQLAAMARREAPLGVPTPAAWSAVQAELLSRLPAVTGTGAAGETSAPLSAGRIRAVAAGSAIACFHSTSTTAERGAFPANEAELDERVMAALRKRGGNAGSADATLAIARSRYRRLDLNGRVPTAPWFSILSHLLIEEPSDADIRISSAVVDGVMAARARRDPQIAAWTGRDRLRRWNRDHLYAAFPELGELARDLERHGDVGIVFLSPASAGLIDSRSDWWPLFDSQGSGTGSRPGGV